MIIVLEHIIHFGISKPQATFLSGGMGVRG